MNLLSKVSRQINFATAIGLWPKEDAIFLYFFAEMPVTWYRKVF